MPHKRRAQGSTARSAYTVEWNKFDRWCALNDFSSIQASIGTIISYLKYLDSCGLAYSTIKVALGSIGNMHNINDIASFTGSYSVRAVFDKIREKNTGPIRKVPITSALVKKIISKTGTDLEGVRDRALILLIYSGALKRKFISNLRWRNVKYDGPNMFIDFYDGEPPIKILSGVDGDVCPVTALRLWQNTIGSQFEHIFPGREENTAISPNTINRIIKNAVVRVGLNPNEYGSHSLRSGSAVTALENKAPESAVGKHLRVRSPGGLQPYAEMAEKRRDAPSGKLGL